MGAVGSAMQTAVADQVRSLVRRFTMRTNRVKSALQESPSSSFDDESQGESTRRGFTQSVELHNIHVCYLL